MDIILFAGLRVCERYVVMSLLGTGYLREESRFFFHRAQPFLLPRQLWVVKFPFGAVFFEHTLMLGIGSPVLMYPHLPCGRW